MAKGKRTKSAKGASTKLHTGILAGSARKLTNSGSTKAGKKNIRPAEDKPLVLNLSVRYEDWKKRQR